MTPVFEQISITGSTNADLLERAASGAPEGLWLRADTQDGGKGRMGRAWESPKGNVYCSTIVRLTANDPAPSTLAFVAALAIQRCLLAFTPEFAFQIKWPNDILSGDGAKFCGMLLERTGDAVVVGIGLNLVHHPEGLDRPVTSLTALGATAPEPQAFVEKLAVQFGELIAQWRLHGIRSILAAWQEHAHPIGTKIIANLPDGQIWQGEYQGLSDDGALKLRLADGGFHVIHAADVFLV